MHILIVSATDFELMDFRKQVQAGTDLYLEKDMQIHFLTAGVGTVPTAYHLGKYLASRDVDCAIQAGVAGSFRSGMHPGDIVNVVSDAFGDTGAEDQDINLDLFELGLWEKNKLPFDNKLLFAPESFPLPVAGELKRVHGLTVNMGSGREETISYRRKKFAADVETMEGAAFHYACIDAGVPFLQIRSISNYVEPRDTSRWKIKMAIDELNQYLINVFAKL